MIELFRPVPATCCAACWPRSKLVAVVTSPEAAEAVKRLLELK